MASTAGLPGKKEKEQTTTITGRSVLFWQKSHCGIFSRTVFGEWFGYICCIVNHHQK